MITASAARLAVLMVSERCCSHVATESVSGEGQLIITYRFLARPERLELPTYWFEAINA